MSLIDERIGHVAVEDGMAVLRIPADQVHGLRVAMQPCPCKMNKSTDTADIRKRIAKALGWAESKLK